MLLGFGAASGAPEQSILVAHCCPA